MMIGTPVALQDNFIQCVRKKKKTLQDPPPAHGGENVPIWEVVRSRDVANRRQTAASTVDGCFIWPRRTLQKRTNCLFGAFTDMSKYFTCGSHVNVCTFL